MEYFYDEYQQVGTIQGEKSEKGFFSQGYVRKIKRSRKTGIRTIRRNSSTALNNR